MEVDRTQCKFPRISNRNGNGRRIGSGDKIGEDRKMDKEGADGERKEVTANSGGGPVDIGGNFGRLYGWPSSRIVRVSRASGGKDRHSKVLTSKGLRDRRVRLSVNTAIQFYDLQDRLGYDQPSKAVEWLLKAAESSIGELPPMNSPFPETPKQVSDEKRSSTGGSDQLGFDSAEAEIDGCGGDPSYLQQNQAAAEAAKSSACSSNSETSKNSTLSLSRSENRIKARARAKERVAGKEKEKDQIESSSPVDSLNPISQTTSFTELLSSGLHNVNDIDNHNPVSPNSSVHQTPARGRGGTSNESNFFLKSPRQWPSTSIDYFTGGLLTPPATRPGQMQFVNAARPMLTVAGNHQSEIQAFSFAPENFSIANSAGGENSDSSSNHHNSGGEYNLNFTISSSSGLAGFDRGTLQSNTSSSPCLLPPVQRFPPADGFPPSFFITAPLENHHQFLSGLDPRLQLYYGNNGRQGSQKEKGKN